MTFNTLEEAISWNRKKLRETDETILKLVKERKELEFRLELLRKQQIAKYELDLFGDKK